MKQIYIKNSCTDSQLDLVFTSLLALEVNVFCKKLVSYVTVFFPDSYWKTLDYSDVSPLVKICQTEFCTCV